MNKNFTKADLRSGMRVVTRNGAEYIVLLDGGITSIPYVLDKMPKGVLVGSKHTGWNSLSSYSEDLEHSCSDFIIDKVCLATDITKIFSQEAETKLIWERAPQKTKEELQIEELQATIAQATEQLRVLKAEAERKRLTK